MATVTEADLEHCKREVQGDLRAWLEQHEKAEFAKHDMLDASLRELKAEVATLSRFFEQGKGALTVLKWLVAVGAGLWAVIVWFKDHVRL